MSYQHDDRRMEGLRALARMIAVAYRRRLTKSGAAYTVASQESHSPVVASPHVTQPNQENAVCRQSPEVGKSICIKVDEVRKSMSRSSRSRQVIKSGSEQSSQLKGSRGVGSEQV